jgi:hypothetical protein
MALEDLVKPRRYWPVESVVLAGWIGENNLVEKELRTTSTVVTFSEF